MTEAMLIKNVSRMLGDTPYTDAITSAALSTYTGLLVASDATQRWEIGDYGEFFDDGTYDIFVLTSVSTTSMSAIGGQLGSTQAAHASGARMRKKPTYWGIQIQRAVNDALQDLWPRAYAVYEAQVSPDLTARAFESIDDDAEEIISAYQKTTTSPTTIREAVVEQPRYVDSTLSSSKKAFEIKHLPVTNTGMLFVQYTRVPTIADLSEGMARAVEYGACVRLLELQGSAAERPASDDPSQQLRDARWFHARQEEMIKREATLLARRFPRRNRNWRGPQHVVI